MIPYFQEDTGSLTFLKAKAIKRTIAMRTNIIEAIDLRRASVPRSGPTESNLLVVDVPKVLSALSSNAFSC
jgi:hypothetical protein